MTRWTGLLAPLLAAALATGPAFAQTLLPVPDAPRATIGTAPVPVALDAQDLATVTAGDVKAEGVSSQNLTAVNANNTIEGSVQSGDVSFSQDALSGFSGVGNFVVNTGSNNNLQGAISINIVTAGP